MSEFDRRIREENTPEYKHFKQVSNEDSILVDIISKNIKVDDTTTILDIGGRNGEISLRLQTPELVTLVDPDPELVSKKGQARLVRSRIQDFETDQKYSLIIFSHVLGDIGREGDQKEVIKKVLTLLSPEGHIILSFNRNTGFMAELQVFASKNIDDIRYDYFDESILNEIGLTDYINENFSVNLRYDNYLELGACCWVLFGTENQDIMEVARVFEPFLEKSLDIPEFVLHERVVIIKNSL